MQLPLTHVPQPGPRHRKGDASQNARWSSQTGSFQQECPQEPEVPASFCVSTHFPSQTSGQAPPQTSAVVVFVDDVVVVVVVPHTFGVPPPPHVAGGVHG